MKPDKILLIAAIVGILIILFATATTPATYQATVISVYDGDTITVQLDTGTVEKVRLIGIDPPDPNHLEIDADPDKTFTIRYHGRYENPEEIRNRDPGVNMDVQEDEARETVKFDPFTEEDEYPTSWAGSEKSNLTHRETNV